MIVYDAQRRPVELGEDIGHGGEATVYRIAKLPGSLAKIYEPEPRPNYAGKLDWMVTHPPENPTESLDHASLAWPGGLLFDSRRCLKGYTMPFISHAVPVLEVFNPRRRAEVLPQFDRRYLLRTAHNLAAALSALHRSGYVAGDINESNVLVTPTALVTLIDTDSFQVSEERDGRLIIHPCPVGKPDYTPPELQGKPLADVIRQPDHDAFGLAVLIFQLLMEGSHPFRAQWLASGDPPPLEVRIANGAYPYVKAPAYPVLPPANALGIESLHPWLTELFRRCFVDGHRDPRWRPGPELWAHALNEAEQAQIRCAEGHYYSSHLYECPYCALRTQRAKNAVVNRAAGRAAPQPGNRPVGGARPRPSWTSSAPFRGKSPFAQSNPAPAAVGAAPAAPFGQRTAAAPRPAVAASSAAQTQTAGSRPAQPAFSSRFASWSGVLGGFSPSSGGAAVFGYPGAGSRGVLRSRPIIPPGAIGSWLRQRTYKSITVGGLQGALVGAVPGALLGLYNWFSGEMLAWTLLFAIGGAAGGLLRGWNPGHKVAALIDRYIGWKLFWQALGLIAGTVAGGMLGLLFIWAVIPVILGLVLGARSGLYLGQKLWQAGNAVGWERIWGAISAFGFAAMGYGVAQLLGLIGLNSFGESLSTGLFPFVANGSFLWAVIWIMAGAAGGALSGAAAGILADLLGRLSGLVN